MTESVNDLRRSRKSRLVVLMSPAEVSVDDNPFVHMLVDSVRPEIDVIDFSWLKAFFCRYDILHIHWPERMTNHPNAVRRTAKSLAFLALLAWNRVRSVAHVGTVHNVRPHEKGVRVEEYAIGVWNRSCRARIYLSKSGLANDEFGTGHYIPHGDYAPFVSSFAGSQRARTDGAILTFGYLRPYKGIEELIEAVRRDDSVRLTVAGKPISLEYADTLRRSAGGTIDLRMRAQTAEELIALITSAEAIVLPYRHIYNSGAAILALTLGRPLIVTPSATMTELQDEVGPEWLEVLPRDWQVDDLRAALGRLNSVPRAAVAPMVGRAWPVVGRLHTDLYKQVAGRTD